LRIGWLGAAEITSSGRSATSSDSDRSASGVTFPQAREPGRGLVRKGRVVGVDVVKVTPATDVNRITRITTGRLIDRLLVSVVADHGTRTRFVPISISGHRSRRG